MNNLFGQPEIGQFYIVFSIDENIVGFDVPVHRSSAVYVGHCGHQIFHIGPKS